MRRLWMVVALSLGCSAAIEHGLDESAANEVVTSLERAGIAASKNRDDSGGDAFVVSVGKSDVVRSMDLLHSLGLPRGRRSGFSEVYKQASLLPTPSEERAKYVEALSGEVVKTLEMVDGVVSARVHLVLPEAPTGVLAVDEKAKVTAQAAVLLKILGGKGQPIAEAEVQKLVAGSVPGLDASAVAVVFTAALPAPAVSSDLVSLGPLRLTAGSRTVVVAAATAACALLAILATLLLLVTRRLGRRHQGA